MVVNVNFRTANCNWVPRQEKQTISPSDFASLVRLGGGGDTRVEGEEGVGKEKGLNFT